MAVIFMDSFQHYATADIPKKWTSGNAYINSGTGRRGGPAAGFGGGGQFISKILSANHAALLLGCAIKPLAADVNFGSIGFTESGVNQIELRYGPDGVIYIYRQSVLLGQSAPGLLLLGAWAYLEIHAIFHNTAGAVTVRVNGATAINLSAVDTTSTANNYATGIIFTTPTHSFLLNDVYLIDPATAPNTTFLGDVRVDAYYPMADGAISQWTPTPSGAHYALVDETAPNTTDYIEADVAGYVDLFQMQDLLINPGAGGFFAVQVCAAAQKMDAGSRQIKPLIRLAGTNYAGSPKDVSDTQVFALGVFDNNPNTAGAWTKTAFDAAEFGVELV